MNPTNPAQPRAGVEVGDHLYVHHRGQACAGVVQAHGRHGVTVDVDGQPHKLKWDKVLGHKKRAEQRYEMIDDGEDGMLVKDHQGKQRYVAVPNEAKEDPLVAKSWGARPVLLFTKADPGGYAGGPGLAKKQITDKRGVQTTKWISTKQDDPKQRSDAAPEAGAKNGFGTHNLSAGDAVNFKAGDFAGAGEIIGEPGAHGAHIKDASGRVHQVLWSEITGHDAKGGAGKPAVKNDVRGEQKPIPADQFSAADFAKSHDADDVTPDAILANFPPDTVDKIKTVQSRLETIEQTIDLHKQDGTYSAERTKIHFKIIAGILSPERIKAATPSEGDAPIFTVLGGRGGSGKSWFDGQVYDANKAIVLDADHIKGQLPEYEGWNAATVHQESSDIFDHLTSMCAKLGLSVVHDKTMKTAKSTLSDLNEFKKMGYRTEAHYMHLPRQEAAKRAVSRFLGKTQRYVPVEVVLANTSNEATFDQVSKIVDKWSFRDNNVKHGDEPILISESGATAPDTKPGQDKTPAALTKSEQRHMIALWKLK